jgi:DnaJ-class molecular chaperone
MAKTSEPTPCPVCGGPLTMRRIDDLTVIEYQARCQACSWAGALRVLRCGGCHGDHLFEWTGEAWRCLDCGRLRDPHRLALITHM